MSTRTPGLTCSENDRLVGDVVVEDDKASLDSAASSSPSDPLPTTVFDQDLQSDSGVVTRNTSVCSNYAASESSLKREADSTTTSGCLTSSSTVSDSKSTLASFKCAYSDSKIPKIDTSNAYILFYERSGLNYKPYLPEVVANGQVVTDPDNEDDENDLRKQPCSIQ